MRKICFVIPTHPSYMMGGAQYQAELIVGELMKQKNKYEVHYITQRAAKNITTPYKLYVLNGKVGKRLGQFSNFYALYRLLKKINPDVIYQRIAGGYTGLCAYYCKKHHKKMIFHIAHDLDVDLHEEKKRRKINSIDRWCKNYGVRNGDVVIAQTANQACLFQKSFKRAVDYQIYNFHFPPNETPTLKKRDFYKIVWVANLKTLKRPELYIKLANLFKANTKFRFVMIGKPAGEKDYQNKMQDLIREAPSLQYLGELPLEEVNKHLLDADIFVNTSFAEGFSNSFIQSWMRGVPVYSLNTNPDFIFDTYPCLGKCFENNFDNLVEAIKVFSGIDLNTFNNIQRLGEELFSITNTKKIIDLF